MKRNQTFGRYGESLAARYLTKKGYAIMHRNWTCRWGELDIVAKKGERIIFVEVKTRRHDVLETVSQAKLSHLKRTIQYYVCRYGHSYSDLQVDFIGIEAGYRLIHLENVLEARL